MKENREKEKRHGIRRRSFPMSLSDYIDSDIPFHFGIEIEFNSEMKMEEIRERLLNSGLCDNPKINKFKRQVEDYNKWRLSDETTCDVEVSSPKFSFCEKDWNEIVQMLKLIKDEFGGTTNECCSIHIHVEKCNAFKTASDYFKYMDCFEIIEPLVLAFSAGKEKTVSEERIYKHAITINGAPLACWYRTMLPEELEACIRDEYSYDEAIDIEKLEEYAILFFERNVVYTVNTPSTGYKTVEYRTYNGTLDADMIKLYIAFSFYLFKIAYNGKNVPTYISEPFEKKHRCKLNKKYVNECLDYIFEDNDFMKNEVSTILKRNKYRLTDKVVRAIDGDYTYEEAKTARGGAYLDIFQFEDIKEYQDMKKNLKMN